MARRLNAYALTAHPGRDVLAEIESRSRIGQAHAIVAAHNMIEAAALLGVTRGELSNHGGGVGRQYEIDLVMSEPGQVFVRALDAFGNDLTKYVRAAVTLQHPRMLRLGACNLDFAAELLAAEKAAKLAEAERLAERDREWREENARRRTNLARCQEALERIRPALAEMGVHPDTLDVGSNANKVGVLLPAEAIEMLVEKVSDLERMMGL